MRVIYLVMESDRNEDIEPIKAYTDEKQADANADRHNAHSGRRSRRWVEPIDLVVSP